MLFDELGQDALGREIVADLRFDFLPGQMRLVTAEQIFQRTVAIQGALGELGGAPAEAAGHQVVACHVASRRRLAGFGQAPWALAPISANGNLRPMKVAKLW